MLYKIKCLILTSAHYSFDCYSKKSQRQEPECSPYWESDLSGLPPTTIMVAEYDGGQSQSEGYAQRLIDAGNQVEKIILLGQTHATIMLRKACSDGDDPAVVAGLKLGQIISK
ncbi:MAG: alpha/beta hydrolase fold domain-containing protein [Legionellales bacterium]|nr:alpha/beta hydrolase fold domain-containing protein [Legionellales bacterium]